MTSLSRTADSESWNPTFSFQLTDQPQLGPKQPWRGGRGLKSRLPFASAATAMSDKFVSNASVPTCAPPPPAKVDMKPASDVIAGAMARAASQGTIHPLDTLKVQLQSGKGRAVKPALSKFGQLVPPRGVASANAGRMVKRALPRIAGLYRGVFGAASGAGIAIGAYFAFYGAATNVLVRNTQMKPATIAFTAGAVAAAGGSIVKVPLAVCIRSVQAGVYPNVIKAASEITAAAGVRGLFTGYLPTLMEDMPDMAFKFASYETLRRMHRQVFDRTASAQEDFAMGAVSGAFAAAATTPLDVIKTTMMCSAASRPSMGSASRAILAQGGPKYFFRGVGARALSNGINSAVFFCFFEALRTSFAKRKEQAQKQAAAGLEASRTEGAPRNLVDTRRNGRSKGLSNMNLQTASLAMSGHSGTAPQ